MCNCKWCGAILALVIFVLSIWPNLFGAMISKWIVAVAAIIIFIGSLIGENCLCGSGQSEKVNPRRAKKRR